MSQLYLEVFIQGLLARIVPWKSEVLVFSHALFGNAEAKTLAVIGSVGALVGYALLYFAGAMIFRALPHLSSPEQQERSANVHVWAHRLLPALLLLAPYHIIGSFLVIAAGFFRLDTRIVLAALLIAEAIQRLLLFAH